ncbi:unnamed protein product [Clonostachys chloroleuca]|uniref:AB hydrolase-1 domain-containing protein n=1 Tax=Clonostachys chloroleuca TaxID=1926264 RepID=A0AA35LP61_9HYPO|nr:unnamed protein product [Clonostachys chloroleuca]
MAQLFALPDGRNLEYLVSGPNHGFPLVWIHGTPSCYLQAPCLPATSDKLGIKIITFSKPGYGRSTRQEGRRVVDTVVDIQALLAHLKVEKCCVGGWSGGGADALACAARLRGCVAILSIAAFAPYDAEGLDWLADKEEASVRGFKAALEGEDELLKHIGPTRIGMVNTDVSTMLEGLSKSFAEADRDAFRENPGMALNLVQSMQEGLRNNCDGWVDDNMAMLAPWGFGLDEIKVPVFLYQGGVDNTVPNAHGKWLSNSLPQGKLQTHFYKDRGHISIYLGHEENIIRELLGAIEL